MFAVQPVRSARDKAIRAALPEMKPLDPRVTAAIEKRIPICTACGARHTRFESCGATGQPPPSDHHDAIMDACRMLVRRLPLSKCELAQELRTCADILEHEMLHTDPPLARLKHNHITRDIKPRGECPGCDAHHDRSRG